jgi:hypothetical protein
MTYIFFLIVLFVAAMLFGLVRLLGFQANYETIFKAVGIFAAMLPVLVMSASVIFVIEVGICLVVFGLLYSTGIVLSILRFACRIASALLLDFKLRLNGRLQSYWDRANRRIRPSQFSRMFYSD